MFTFEKGRLWTNGTCKPLPPGDNPIAVNKYYYYSAETPFQNGLQSDFLIKNGFYV
jgi:hypothetical protein